MNLERLTIDMSFLVFLKWLGDIIVSGRMVAKGLIWVPSYSINKFVTVH